jgi:hypothetical protein
MAISQPPFQSTLVDANDRVQTPWAQWFSQLQPILQSIVASGPTSGRPTQNLYIGYPYFDTTIDQMVYWNGVIWVTYAPSTTGTSILKGNGSGGFNNAVAGVDFAPATSGTAILYGNGSGGFSLVSIGSGVTFAGGVLSATGSGGTVTAVTGTAPIASSGGNTPAISISQAGASTNGYLSSTDWNTFNNKGSGTVTAVTGSGNIASSGGTTPNITFTGTLPIANGGTNGTATPTAGAVAVGNGTQYAFTAAGSAGQVLTSNGSTVPTWATVATGIGTTGYWGSFWDTTNQTAASTTVAYTINIGTSDPNNNGVSIVSSNRITVAYAGVYNLQYSIQFQNIGTGNKNYNVDVWFRLNGVDIPDSNSIYWIASKNSTVNGEMIAAVNYVMSLNAGDYIQILWAVSDVDISIATLPAASSPTVPRTPGVIVTVTPVTEVGIGYYNLTSVSSVAIATGSKTFTSNLSNISTAFTVGTRVRVAYVTTPANYMEGVITSFSGTTLVVNVDSIGGSGTYANWTISVAGIQGSNGVTSITGTANQVIASASTGAVTLSLPQDIATTSSPTFVGTNFSGTATSLSIGGNAATASKWATARNLAGNSVDGSANVAFANKFIVQGTTDTGLTGAQFLGALGTGLVKNTTSTGVLSIAASGTDYAPATSGSAILYGNGSGGFSSVTIGTGVSFTTGTLSATGSGGTVTSVAGTGTVNGITLTGTVTSSGSLTLGGTLGGIGNSQLTNSSITFGATSQALGSTVSALNAVSIGAATASTGAFTTLSASGQTTLTNATGYNLYASGAALNYLAGNLGIGSVPLTTANLYIAASLTGGTTAIGVQSASTIQTSVTTQANIYYSAPATVAAAFTCTTLNHYFVNSIVIGAGSAVTQQRGFAVGGGVGGVSGVTNTYAFLSNLASAAGSWNCYMGGTAANYFAGNVLIGSTVQPTTASNIVIAGLLATSGAAPTIASATTIAPTKAITFISGTTAIVTITAPNPISAGGGQITLIPTGIFTTTIAGNIALASTAVVGKALIMTYDTTTAKWYPSY